MLDSIIIQFQSYVMATQYANTTVLCMEIMRSCAPSPQAKYSFVGWLRKGPKLTSALISSRQDGSLSLSDPPYISHLRAMGMFQRCVVFIISLTFLPFMSTDYGEAPGLGKADINIAIGLEWLAPEPTLPCYTTFHNIKTCTVMSMIFQMGRNILPISCINPNCPVSADSQE